MRRGEKWLTKREAAEYCRCSEKSIDRAIRQGRIQRARNGVRKVLISESSLVGWMNGEAIGGARS